LASYAKNTAREQPARFGVIAIGLAEMRAVAAKFNREQSIVIQQKRDVARSSNGHQDFGGARNVIF
jgi:hypothetical protein